MTLLLSRRMKRCNRSGTLDVQVTSNGADVTAEKRNIEKSDLMVAVTVLMKPNIIACAAKR
jgi:hypothetical protein